MKRITIDIEEDGRLLYGDQLGETCPLHIAELAEAMREQGFDEARPLLLLETSQGLEILNGRHRWEAAQEAGLAEVPARVITWDEFGALEPQTGGDMEYLESLLPSC